MSARDCCDGRRRDQSPVQSVHVVHGSAGQVLQVAVSAAGHEPRITVTTHEGGPATAGGFVPVREIRRLARALAADRARTRVPLAAAGPLPGGTLAVAQDGADVYLTMSTEAGSHGEYGPIPSGAVAAICRDVVGWHRLLQHDAEPAR